MGLICRIWRSVSSIHILFILEFCFGLLQNPVGSMFCIYEPPGWASVIGSHRTCIKGLSTPASRQIQRPLCRKRNRGTLESVRYNRTRPVPRSLGFFPWQQTRPSLLFSLFEQQQIACGFHLIKQGTLLQLGPSQDRQRALPLQSKGADLTRISRF